MHQQQFQQYSLMNFQKNLLLKSSDKKRSNEVKQNESSISDGGQSDENQTTMNKNPSLDTFNFIAAFTSSPSHLLNNEQLIQQQQQQQHQQQNGLLAAAYYNQLANSSTKASMSPSQQSPLCAYQRSYLDALRFYKLAYGSN